MTYSDPSPYTVSWIPTTALFLNIHNTSSTVSFTFDRAVTSFEFVVYDLSRSTSTLGSYSYMYRDRIQLSQPVTPSGTTSSLNSTAAGTDFHRTASYTTENNANNVLTLKGGPLAANSPFTLTYTNGDQTLSGGDRRSNGFQWIALGPIKACF